MAAWRADELAHGMALRGAYPAAAPLTRFPIPPARRQRRHILPWRINSSHFSGGTGVDLRSSAIILAC